MLQAEPGGLDVSVPPGPPPSPARPCIGFPTYDYQEKKQGIEIWEVERPLARSFHVGIRAGGQQAASDIHGLPVQPR